MLVHTAVIGAFVILAWGLIPSRAVRELGRRVALGLVTLGLIGAVGAGLLQLARPDLLAWTTDSTVQDWLHQEAATARAVPNTVWCLLGAATLLAAGLQSLRRDLPRPARMSHTAARLPLADLQPYTNGVSPHDLEGALDAMTSARQPQLPLRTTRRVETLLPR